jgi:hypothetical protein
MVFGKLVDRLLLIASRLHALALASARRSSPCARHEPGTQLCRCDRACRTLQLKHSLSVLC